MRISDWSSDVCSSDLIRRSACITGILPLFSKGCRRGEIGDGLKSFARHAVEFAIGALRHALVAMLLSDVKSGRLMMEIRVLQRNTAIVAFCLALPGCASTGLPTGEQADRKSTRLNSSH